MNETLILRALLHLVLRIDAMSAEFDALKAQVDAAVSTMGTAGEKIDGFAGTLAALQQNIADLQAQVAAGVAPAEFQGVTDALKAATDALAAKAA